LKKRSFMKGALAASLVISGLTMGAGSAFSQEIKLKLHQFLPPQANVPRHILKPWADSVKEVTGGKVEVQSFDAMALGGKPPELIDQVRDGIADIVWTVVGYTPGRFPRTEVFELPFTMTNAEATSRAYWELFKSDMETQDFAEYKILGAWVHGPGVIHAKGEGVRSLEDMAGKKLRGPSRMTNELLEELGAVPVGLPVPALPEALSKGVIDGAVIPWEVTTALKIAELTNTHTEFAGDNALYTVTFVLAMNKEKWESLSDELKAQIDSVSGLEFSASAGRIMQEYDVPGRQVAVDRGNTIITIEGAELERWKEASNKIAGKWAAEMKEKGIDGEALIAKAKAAIASHTN
jgi:TRAP-type C4-dicarboxylate transport system substrate-binding protein